MKSNMNVHLSWWTFCFNISNFDYSKIKVKIITIFLVNGASL